MRPDDWAPLSHVVDVGGGDGTLLAAILGSDPQLSIHEWNDNRTVAILRWNPEETLPCNAR